MGQSCNCQCYGEPNHPDRPCLMQCTEKGRKQENMEDSDKYITQMLVAELLEGIGKGENHSILLTRAERLSKHIIVDNNG